MTTHAFAPRFDLSNVFMPARDTLADAQETSADATEQTFALVKNGPAVNAEEVESHVDAVEVTVRWGSQVLSVKHLESGKSFFVGEGADLALPEDVLGASRVAIVESRSGGAYVAVPCGARGHVARKGGRSEDIDGTAGEIALEPGMSVTLEVGAVRADGTTGEPITFEITTVRAGKVAPVGFLAALAGGATGFVGLSFLGHAAIVASLAMFMPTMATDDADAIDRDQMMLMQKFLSASAEREQDQVKPELTATASEATGGGSTGQAHQGESGAAGTTKPVTTKGHAGFKGNDATSALSPKSERELAATFGMISFLPGAAQTDPNAPASPWAKEYKGNDSKSAMGAMWGTSIDDASGTGLGLSGNDEGGGGSGEGIGIDRVGTIGGGGGGTGKWGIGKGDKDGIGNGHAPGGGGHVAKAPILRNPSLETNGRLPAEVIQRVVRLNFGRFRLCYEAGLRGNPSLTGRVATKFVIGRDGLVVQASDAGSDLPDQAVVACVVRSFQNLTFPAPEGGIATVTYPILLSPGQ